MDFKKILGKLDLFEGLNQGAGPKFPGKWKGTDIGTPGKKVVGDSIEPDESILKDLQKGPTAKTKEQELAEDWDAFQTNEEPDPMEDAWRLAYRFMKTKRNWEDLELGGLGYDKNGNINVELIASQGSGSHHVIDGQTGKELQNETMIAPTSEPEINPDTMLTFLRNGFKRINDYADSYSDDGMSRLVRIYQSLRSPLMKGDIQGFHDVYAKISGEYPDAFDAFMEEVYDSVEVNDYDSFIKAATDVDLSEDDLGVNPKRPGRNGARHARGHAPVSGYKTVKDTEKATDESRGHKVISSKLKDIESQGKPISDTERDAHVMRMKAKMKDYQAANPKSIYKKVDEYGANQPAGTAGQKMVQTAMPTTQDVAAANNQGTPQQVAATAQATQTIKAASGATAPNDVIAKALDAVSKGQQVSPQDMQTLQPILKNVAAAGQDPTLANDYKTLASKAKIFQQTQK